MWFVTRAVHGSLLNKAVRLHLHNVTCYRQEFVRDESTHAFKYCNVHTTCLKDKQPVMTLSDVKVLSVFDLEVCFLWAVADKGRDD